MIIVGTNIPELAPLEDGTGAVLSYRKNSGAKVAMAGSAPWSGKTPIRPRSTTTP